MADPKADQTGGAKGGAAQGAQGAAGATGAPNPSATPPSIGPDDPNPFDQFDEDRRSDEEKERELYGNRGDEEVRVTNSINPPPISPNDEMTAFKRFAGIRFAIEIHTVDYHLGQRPGSEKRSVTPFDQNGYLMCNITKKHLRGFWSNSAKSLQGKAADNAIASMPDIPGIHIIFDGSRRAVMIQEPLLTKDNAEILEEIRNITRQTPGMKTFEPERSRKFEALSLDRLKQWVYWPRRYLDSGYARLKHGSVPLMPEIERLPGRVERETFNVNSARTRFSGTHHNGVEVPQYMTPKEAAGTMM